MEKIEELRLLKQGSWTIYWTKGASSGGGSVLEGL